MPLCAAPCRCSQSRRRKYALFLTLPPLCQRGGRRFEPGLVLQNQSPVERLARRGFLVRVMVGGLLGALLPTAHPRQRHQVARADQRLRTRDRPSRAAIPAPSISIPPGSGRKKTFSLHIRAICRILVIGSTLGSSGTS